MEPVIPLVIAVSIIVGTAMTLGAIAAFLGTPEDRSRTSPNTLAYCQYCGCRHRVRWMRWEDGHYRCSVCCERTFR